MHYGLRGAKRREESMNKREATAMFIKAKRMEIRAIKAFLPDKAIKAVDEIKAGIIDGFTAHIDKTNEEDMKESSKIKKVNIE